VELTWPKKGIEHGLKHFDKYTVSHTAGVYRLLIVNGHSSHATPKFDQYCIQNKIISLCMPAHSSYLLQPLDVSYYSPLKRVYGQEIAKLARLYVYYINKLEFLRIYPRIRLVVFTRVVLDNANKRA
jgi:hypothetical protein